MAHLLNMHDYRKAQQEQRQKEQQQQQASLLSNAMPMPPPRSPHQPRSHIPPRSKSYQDEVSSNSSRRFLQPDDDDDDVNSNNTRRRRSSAQAPIRSYSGSSIDSGGMMPQLPSASVPKIGSTAMSRSPTRSLARSPRRTKLEVTAEEETADSKKSVGRKKNSKKEHSTKNGTNATNSNGTNATNSTSPININNRKAATSKKPTSSSSKMMTSSTSEHAPTSSKNGITSKNGSTSKNESQRPRLKPNAVVTPVGATTSTKTNAPNNSNNLNDLFQHAIQMEQDGSTLENVIQKTLKRDKVKRTPMYRTKSDSITAMSSSLQRMKIMKNEGNGTGVSTTTNSNSNKTSRHHHHQQQQQQQRSRQMTPDLNSIADNSVTTEDSNSVTSSVNTKSTTATATSSSQQRRRAVQRANSFSSVFSDPLADECYIASSFKNSNFKRASSFHPQNTINNASHTCWIFIKVESSKDVVTFYDIPTLTYTMADIFDMIYAKVLSKLKLKNQLPALSIVMEASEGLWCQATTQKVLPMEQPAFQKSTLESVLYEYYFGIVGNTYTSNKQKATVDLPDIVTFHLDV